MALNLKTLGVRALSSVVFVAVLLGCLLWNYYSFTIFFFVVAIMGLNEFFKLAEKLGAKPYRFIGYVGAVIVYLSFMHLKYFTGSRISQVQYLVFLIPFLILAGAMFSKRDNPAQNALFTIAGIIYAVLPFALLHQLVVVRGEDEIQLLAGAYVPEIVLVVILLIWSNDTFAYLGGSLFGKHKMIPRVSPGKTWEGTIFGVLVTFGLSFLIGPVLLEGRDSWFWPALGIIVPVLATIGDLVESMLKRQAGVKDTGSIMPGHGGVLDRFDSLIFVTPFVYVLLNVL